MLYKFKLMQLDRLDGSRSEGHFPNEKRPSAILQTNLGISYHVASKAASRY